MNDLILKCEQPAGETILLTAAVRDLHRNFPGMFRVGVRTRFPEVWENNPNVFRLDESEGDVIVLECRNPLIQRGNELPVHCIQGYLSDLSKQLHLNIRATEFKPDIHLSAEEKALTPPALAGAGWSGPYWLLNAGGTHRHTVKWWEAQRYQEVVERFRGRIQFVQVGRAGDCHPDLAGVLDLRGKTTLRQLIHLVHYAEGVLTPPGLLAHLAAAVPARGRRARACVVIAGGREPAHWASYPGQQYVNTIGMLPCCETGGCWRSRVAPLGDGQPEDQAEHLCVCVSGSGPQCMAMISAQEVIERIDRLLQGKDRFADEVERAKAANGPGLRLDPAPILMDPLTGSEARSKAERFIESLEDYPGGHAGRGIVVCAGGPALFANAWVCINMLRHLGCALPIQIWHLGPEEVDQRMRSLIKPLKVECVDALEVRQRHPARRLGGWELKPYAIIQSPFKEVMLLDADNVPVVNPEFLFDTPQFGETGAIFWPDFGHLRPNDPIWKICGLPFQDEPEWESGQVVVSKEKCWKALRLAMWYNEHSDFFYKYVLGDKETFHLAFRKLEQRVAMPEHPVRALQGTLCQHDFEGRRIFQHRTSKWKLFENNTPVLDFCHEKECLAFLRQFRESWSPPRELIDRIDLETKSAREQEWIREIAGAIYEYVRVGFDRRTMTFSPRGNIEIGSAGCEKYWDLREEAGEMVLEISNENHPICRLTEDGLGNWKGRWLYFEKMPVELNRVVDPSLSPAFPRRHVLHQASAPQRKQVIFRATLNGYTGYGLHAVQIVRDLTKMGYDVLVRAHNLNETHAPIPLDVRKLIVSREIRGDWELVLTPPGGFGARERTQSVVFTMWESTRIPPAVTARLNRAFQIIVPCQWNASCLSACGVDRPINIVPLGIKPDVFKYVPMEMAGPCVFGVAGRLQSGGMRKGINEVMLAFREAFPNEEDVRLHVKVFSDDELLRVDDPRIQLTNRCLDEPGLAGWFAGLACFISCSHGEAWGLMLHQALAVGRPVMTMPWGGVTEFFTTQIGYPVDFRLAPAEGFYAGLGLWAEADPRSLIEQMRRVYRNRQEAAEKGLKGSQSVSHLTWERSNALLANILKQVGMLT